MTDTAEIMLIQHGEFLRAIPMSILNEEGAQTNHNQSLERLRERHGIDPIEAIGIIENQWPLDLEMSKSEAERQLMQIMINQGDER